MKILSVATRYDTQQTEERIISHSRMSAAVCPLRYRREYIEGAKPTFESIELGIGKYFHSYVEGHLKQIAARGRVISAQDTLDIPDLLRNFRLAFIWENRLRAPYRICRNNMTITDIIERLQTIAWNFNNFIWSTLIGHRVAAVEGELQIRTEEFDIRGKYDLITSDPSGRLILWDWKTGRAPEPGDWQAYRDQKVQTGFYAVWLRHWSRTPEVRGTSLFLRDPPYRSIQETYTVAVEQDVLEYAAAWRRRVNSWREYPAVVGPLCDWCGWNTDCPAYASITRPAIETVRPASPSPTPPAAPKPAQRRSECFIATCAYGSSQAADVCLLRRFRDEHLRRTRAGRQAIALYEAIGPRFAQLIAHQPAARKAIRRIIHHGIVPFVRQIMARSRQGRGNNEHLDRDSATANIAHGARRCG